jgi:nicotinamidase-related amidase
MARFIRSVQRCALGGLVAAGLAAWLQPAGAQTIVQAWDTIKPPPPPELQNVIADPRTTALLMLDFVKQICNSNVCPRCLETLPHVAALLKQARAAGVLVVYSLAPSNQSTEDVLPEVAPRGNEPVVKSGPDKFINTDLEQILKSHGITAVVPIGVLAEGAVMYTGSHAAFVGMKVLLPVDGMSSRTLYAEQYVAWNMSHAPTVSGRTTLTSIAQLKF